MKLTNMLRGKERKKRKKEQICKVKQRQMKKIYIHQRLSARGKEQQERQTKEQKKKKNNRFEEMKIKIIKKRKDFLKRKEKGNLHRTAKA